MRRITAMAVALIAPALLTGCENDDVTGPEADVVGEFRATDFGFFSTVNPIVARDLDRAGAVFTLEFNEDRTFEATFIEAPSATPLVRTGTFTMVGDELVLGNQALIPGAQDVEQRFTFQRRQDGLSLQSADPVNFDFNENGGFEPEEAALFRAELELF